MSNYDLFESYIFQKLSAEEMQKFDSRIASDTAFREDYESHLQLQSALDVLVEDDISTVIKSIKNKEGQSDLHPQENIKSIIPKRWMSIAAACMLLIAISFIIKDRLIPTESPLLLANIFVPYEKQAHRGTTDVTLSVDIYESYGKEINALVKNKKWEEAADILTQLMTTTEGTSYHDEAEWNLAVVYAEYDKKKALTILEKILSDPQHDYHDIDNVQRLKTSLQ